MSKPMVPQATIPDGKKPGVMSHYSQSRQGDSSVTIEWKDVVFSTLLTDKAASTHFKTVFQVRKILKGLNGRVTSGEMLAVMVCFIH